MTLLLARCSHAIAGVFLSRDYCRVVTVIGTVMVSPPPRCRNPHCHRGNRAMALRSCRDPR
ncbi:MAG: hypothetical protein FWF28_02640, partial [Micrococcales bacterium]|nr:hypothetical protein [Micrococcales bacterium]